MLNMRSERNGRMFFCANCLHPSSVDRKMLKKYEIPVDKSESMCYNEFTI